MNNDLYNQDLKYKFVNTNHHPVFLYRFQNNIHTLFQFIETNLDKIKHYPLLYFILFFFNVNIITHF